MEFLVVNNLAKKVHLYYTLINFLFLEELRKNSIEKKRDVISYKRICAHKKHHLGIPAPHLFNIVISVY